VNSRVLVDLAYCSTATSQLRAHAALVGLAYCSTATNEPNELRDNTALVGLVYCSTATSELRAHSALVDIVYYSTATSELRSKQVLIGQCALREPSDDLARATTNNRGL